MDDSKKLLESESAGEVKQHEAEAHPETEPLKITMRHPHTLDTVEVEATSEALTPWMVQGYQHYNPPAEPVKE